MPIQVTTTDKIPVKWYYGLAGLIIGCLLMMWLTYQCDKPDPATASKIQSNNDSIAKYKKAAEMAKKTADDLLHSYRDNRTAAAKKATKHIEKAKDVRKVVFDTVGNARYLLEYKSVNQ